MTECTAAAPEMLEALKRAFRLLKPYIADNSIYTEWVNIHKLINKAEGGT